MSTNWMRTITTEIIILPKFYIILVIKFFTFYHRFSSLRENILSVKIFSSSKRINSKIVFFPKDFVFVLVKLSTASRVVERLMIEMRDKITSLGALVVVCPVCFRNFGNFGFKNVLKNENEDKKLNKIFQARHATV